MTRLEVMELWEQAERLAAHMTANGFRNRQWIDGWLAGIADWCAEKLLEMESS